MKKFTLYFAIACMMLSVAPAQLWGAAAAATPATMSAADPATPAHVVALTTRLEAINAIDRSGLTTAERRGLRREVRAINSELKAANGGVYLSVGAIIIIILLLVLLL